MTRSPGSQVSARGPRTASGSSGCRRCSLPSAIRSARIPAVHVVGTNGKSTATVTIEQTAPRRGPLGRLDDLAARPRLERADSDRRTAGRPRRRAPTRPAGRGAGRCDAVRDDHRCGAARPSPTREVDVAVVEAGLGGRFDATNVLRSRVVLLTNVGLEHTDVLGDTVEAIATEKLAVVHTDDTIVVLPDDTFRPLVPRGEVRDRWRARGCGGVRRASRRSPRARGRSRVGSSAGPARSATARTTRTESPGSASALPDGATTRLRLDPRGQGRRS